MSVMNVLDSVLVWGKINREMAFLYTAVDVIYEG